MTRRGFLAQLGALVSLPVVAALAPTPEPLDHWIAENGCEYWYRPHGELVSIQRPGELSIRFVRDVDSRLMMPANRMDVIYGWQILRPELACKVLA